MNTTDRTDARLIRALTSQRRRVVLSHLCQRDGRTPIAELSRAVEQVEAPLPDGEARPGAAISSELWHVHLPLLSSTGLVSVDREGGTVALRPDAVALELSLEQFSELAASLDDLGG